MAFRCPYCSFAHKKPLTRPCPQCNQHLLHTALHSHRIRQWLSAAGSIVTAEVKEQSSAYSWLFRGAVAGAPGHLCAAVEREARFLHDLEGTGPFPRLVHASPCPLSGLPGAFAQFIEGHRLSDIRQLRVPEAIPLMLKIAEAVALLHDQGLVHGSLSPERFIVNPSGALYVTNFLWARRVREPMGEVRCPSLVLAAPELGDPLAQAQLTMDVWALGACCYFILTKRYPKRPSRSPGLRIEPPSKFNRAVTVALDDLILRAMMVNPHERYSHAGQFMEELAGRFGRITGVDGAGPAHSVPWYAPVLNACGSLDELDRAAAKGLKQVAQWLRDH